MIFKITGFCFIIIHLKIVGKFMFIIHIMCFKSGCKSAIILRFDIVEQ